MYIYLYIHWSTFFIYFYICHFYFSNVVLQSLPDKRPIIAIRWEGFCLTTAKLGLYIFFTVTLILFSEDDLSPSNSSRTHDLPRQRLDALATELLGDWQRARVLSTRFIWHSASSVQLGSTLSRAYCVVISEERWHIFNWIKKLERCHILHSVFLRWSKHMNQCDIPSVLPPYILRWTSLGSKIDPSTAVNLNRQAIWAFIARHLGTLTYPWYSIPNIRYTRYQVPLVIDTCERYRGDSDTARDH